MFLLTGRANLQFKRLTGEKKGSFNRQLHQRGCRTLSSGMDTGREGEEMRIPSPSYSWNGEKVGGLDPPKEGGTSGILGFSAAAPILGEGMLLL